MAPVLSVASLLIILIIIIRYFVRNKYDLIVEDLRIIDFILYSYPNFFWVRSKVFCNIFDLCDNRLLLYEIFNVNESYCNIFDMNVISK